MSKQRGQKSDQQREQRKSQSTEPFQYSQGTIQQQQVLNGSLTMTSENEEAATGQQQQHQSLQQQSSLSNSNNSTSLSIFGSSRLDDEDPIFTLDEEVHAKELSGERTRHYTADFDPTVSDEDEFPKEIGNLHGGRAYSASTRFPPRIRHSGRTAGQHQNTGILQNKFYGHFEVPPTAVPASLPIQISRGFNWPPRELVGSLSEEEDGDGSQAGKGTNNGERRRARTTMEVEEAVVEDAQQHESEREDLFGRIQAYSRSIQPEDDPERIFGERPHRRYSVAKLLDQQSGDGTADSCGENIPPSSEVSSTTFAAISSTSSIPVFGRISGGTGSSSTTVGTPRVIIPASLSG